MAPVHRLFARRDTPRAGNEPAYPDLMTGPVARAVERTQGRVVGGRQSDRQRRGKCAMGSGGRWARSAFGRAGGGRVCRAKCARCGEGQHGGGASASAVVAHADAAVVARAGVHLQ